MRLEVKNLCFSYRDVSILQDVSFQAHTHGITAIMGPNGSGKTTLLRCINRILSPHSGEVLLGDRSIAELSTREIARSIAYVAQKNQTCTMNVFDAVLLGRVPHIRLNISEDDIVKTTGIIDRLGLSSLSMRPLYQLSGGELQKVSIARALVQDTPLILLDEPTASLDIKNQVAIISLLHEISQEQGIKVLMSIHDLNTAFQFADQFLFMKGGRLVAVADHREAITPEIIEDVYDIPVDMRWHQKVPLVTPRVYRKY